MIQCIDLVGHMAMGQKSTDTPAFLGFPKDRKFPYYELIKMDKIFITTKLFCFRESLFENEAPKFIFADLVFK